MRTPQLRKPLSRWRALVANLMTLKASVQVLIAVTSSPDTSALLHAPARPKILMKAIHKVNNAICVKQ